MPVSFGARVFRPCFLAAAVAWGLVGCQVACAARFDSSPTAPPRLNIAAPGQDVCEWAPVWDLQGGEWIIVRYRCVCRAAS